MKDWFEEYPDLLEYEIQEFKNNGIQIVDFKIDLEAFKSDGVVLNCIIPVKNNIGLEIDKELGLKIIFPGNYPYFRPEVFVTTDTSLPRHQNPLSKNLCLIPRPTQYWNTRDSLFNYLEERLPIVLSKGLIEDQNIIGKDPNEQAEPVSEYYINKTNAVVLSSRPNFENLDLPDVSETFTVLDHGFLILNYNKVNTSVKLFDTSKTKEGLVYFPKHNLNSDILKITLNEWLDKDGKSIGKFPYNILNNSSLYFKTKWYKVNSLTALLKNENAYNWLINELERNEISKPKKFDIHTENYVITSAVGLLFPEEEVAGKIGWGWLLFVDGYTSLINKNNQKIKKSLSLVLPIMSVDHSDLTVRSPYSECLKDKTISIIGLGSLGAPSVIEFAKNGVAKLKLMDFDIVDYSTTVRWPLGIESAGSLKTIALKNFIKKNYPNVEVELFNHRIGSTNVLAFPDENKILDNFLNNSSLVYDASAEVGVNHLISTLCKKRNLPYVEIEGRRGAWGGLVMRVLPKTNKGCWMCLQHSLYKDKTIPIPKEDNNGSIQPKGCGDLTFTGSSFDLQNISLAGVRMAISSLSDDLSNQDWDVAVLSMVDDNDQPITPEWIPRQLEINTECKICNDKSLD